VTETVRDREDCIDSGENALKPTSILTATEENAIELGELAKAAARDGLTD
jgi:hypothetical protein